MHSGRRRELLAVEPGGEDPVKSRGEDSASHVCLWRSAQVVEDLPIDTQNLHSSCKHRTWSAAKSYTYSSEKALAGFLASSQDWRQRIASRPKAYLCNSMRYTWGWGSETLIQGVENESAIAGNDYVDDERRDRSGSAQTQVIASLAT